MQSSNNFILFVMALKMKQYYFRAKNSISQFFNHNSCMVNNMMKFPNEVFYCNKNPFFKCAFCNVHLFAVADPLMLTIQVKE